MSERVRQADPAATPETGHIDSVHERPIPKEEKHKQPKATPPRNIDKTGFTPLNAQIAPACPVVFDEPGFWSQPSATAPRGIYIAFKLLNPNSTDITGVKLFGTYQDSVGDEHDFINGFMIEQIKAGKSRSGFFDTEVSLDESFKQPKVWIEKIRFSNGDTWVDDGSHSCAAAVSEYIRFGH